MPKYFGDMLRAVRNGLKLSLPALSEQLSIDRNTLGSYEREERLPDVEFIAEFARVTNCDLAKLIEARFAASSAARQIESAMRALRAATNATSVFVMKRSGLPQEECARIQQVAYEKSLDADGLEAELGGNYPPRVSEPRAGYSYVPLYQLAASAGNGGGVIDHEEIVDVLAFKEDWIRQELHVRPNDLRLIYVEGDSMQPDLHPGDIILIDHTDTHARREGVYVLRMDGALLVKQLQRLPGGVIKVISRNAAYDPFTLNAADLDEGNGTAIIGRVVWACRRF